MSKNITTPPVRLTFNQTLTLGQAGRLGKQQIDAIFDSEAGREFTKAANNIAAEHFQKLGATCVNEQHYWMQKYSQTGEPLHYWYYCESVVKAKAAYATARSIMGITDNDQTCI